MLNLSQFCGTENYYFNPLYPALHYTDGVKYFINEANCHWFLDIVGTEIFALSKNHSFISINLIVADSSADIVSTDGNNQNIYLKHVTFTDCEEGVYKFYLQNNVFFLTSEY